MIGPSHRWMLPAAILFVGINLRPSIAVIGPLLDTIQHSTGLSDSGSSLLTTLPVGLMGAVLFAIRPLRAAVRDKTAIATGLILLLFSHVVRFVLPSASILLMTAVCGGIGIALVQAVMPAVIRRHAKSDAAGMMGLYSTAIMAGALISAMAGPWLAVTLNWRAALGIWVVPAAIALLIWRHALGPETVVHRVCDKPLHLYREPRAWLLLAFFGLSTGAYTLVLAWLPPFYTQMGWSAQRAGGLLAAVTVAEVIAGLAVSSAINRLPDRRPALLMAIGALFLGMLGLAISPQTFAWQAAVSGGLGIGALFPLSIIVAMDHGDEPDEAAAIAAFVQGGGYVLAAVMPLVAGLLRQILADLSLAWWLMMLLCAVLGLIAIRLDPRRRIPNLT
ncbi:MFS transporter [Rhizobium oryzicola]|uniref:MFS transporter n=1 Tax=Rhizobium oryzicola TaxID=1232668 RepID=A0ABT8T3U6_9HYPH|nr:MFS transporter [Rhizobium oryzicola]MDO1585419.1 MFS transporter [Rhizobium oryzicola]